VDQPRRQPALLPNPEQPLEHRVALLLELSARDRLHAVCKTADKRSARNGCKPRCRRTRRYARLAVASIGSAVEPLSRVLPRLMRERRLTYRALAARTRELDPQRGVSTGHLANLVSGRSRPSIPILEIVARALEVYPTEFAEYTLAQLREELDPTRAGFDAAWRRYRELLG
jgi:transcriptional regulator with XRE-family HTH domain